MRILMKEFSHRYFCYIWHVLTIMLLKFNLLNIFTYLYRVVLRMIKMCCEEASWKLASDFKNYLNISIYKLEGQKNTYETIIGGTLSVINQILCTIRCKYSQWQLQGGVVGGGGWGGGGGKEVI